jgi:hypothetical protein
MIAALFRTPEDTFDYPVLAVFLYMYIMAAFGIVGLWRGYKRGRVLFAGLEGRKDVYVYRDENPRGFWLLITVYAVGALLAIVVATACALGVFRKT